MTSVYSPGDLIFCHSKGFISRAIRAAEWLRFRKGSQFNHVAILYRSFPPSGTLPGGWFIIQAETRGVTCTKTLDSLTAKGGTYTVVHPQAVGDSVYNPKLLVEFARSQVGRSYGFLTIVSILFTLFTPKFIDFLLPNTWICSALAAESLRCAGWLHNWPDIYQVSPAQLWEAIQ